MQLYELLISSGAKARDHIFTSSMFPTNNWVDALHPIWKLFAVDRVVSVIAGPTA